MGKLVRFTTPNQHKRIFIYGNLFSQSGPWEETDDYEEPYNERIIKKDTLGIILRIYKCSRFDTTFYGVITSSGHTGWVHHCNAEILR